MELRVGIEPTIKVLQTFLLTIRASEHNKNGVSAQIRTGNKTFAGSCVILYTTDTLNGALGGIQTPIIWVEAIYSIR